jgi:tripartite-type tricarboxylate transporter receptor subunit TctC
MTTKAVIASAAKQSRGPVALLILLIAAAPGALAQDFYKGRTINLYIGFGVGGSYDLYGRLVAQHLGRHIPGMPTIVPLQMPGAGGLAAANYMAKVAAKDGSAIAITSQTVVLDQLTGETGVAYDARDFSWLGRVTTSATLFFTWHSSPTKTFADAQARETTMGSSGSGDTTDPPRALNALGGAKFKLVLGYRGSNEVQLAVERGEIEGGYALWSDFKFRKADWLRDRQVNLLFFVADKRQPDYPDVPLSSELVPTAEDKRIMALFAAPSVVGRSFFAAPGIPAARLALLRHAFAEMLVDQGFLADAARVGLALDPMSGDDLQENIRVLLATPADLVAKAKKVREP